MTRSNSTPFLGFANVVMAAVPLVAVLTVISSFIR
jgi:hypothetical protein